jgi:CRP/FNR family transcriptional regulator, cyclic AMP receptor protein
MRMPVQPSNSPRRQSADREDQLAAVKSNGFLARLSPERAADLISSAPLVHYPAGCISAPARDAPWAAIVVSGVVRVYLPTADGRQVTIRYAKAGDLVGNPTAGRPRVTVEVEAVEASELLHLDVARMDRTARVEPELSMAMVEELTSRLRHVYQALASNTFATVRTRVARDLLERTWKAEAPGPGAHVPATQQALADATGSVREVVARALRELRLQGVIETDQSGITILDFDALIREAGQRR